MIITIFGDVHGNLIALEKLFKMEDLESDAFICHGDVVNYGPWSNECVNFLSQKDNIEILKGNHEEFFISGNYEGKNEVANAFFDFCYPSFESKNIEIIKKYKDCKVLGNYAIQHTIANQYIFKDTNIDDLVIDKNYIIGHSHQQFFRSKDKFEIYNTGSLGQNRKYLNQSCYLKLDTKTNEVILKSFDHDIDKVINEMKIKKYPKICIDYYLSKERL